MDTITEQRGENHTLILGTCKRWHDEKLRQHDCRDSGTQWKGQCTARNRAEVPDQSSQEVTEKQQPKPECIQASGLDLIAIIGKGEGMDAVFKFAANWKRLGSFKNYCCWVLFSKRFKFNWYE